MISEVVVTETSDIPEKCIECGGFVGYTFPDVVCTRCGLVQRRISTNPMDPLPEHTEQQEPSSIVETGERPNVVNGLGTFVGGYYKNVLYDYRGKELSAEKQDQFQRQKKINDKEVHTQGKKRHYRALRMLNALTAVLELSYVVKDDAAKLFKRTETKLEGEVYIAEMIAGAVYLSVKTSSNEQIQFQELIEGCKNASLSVRSNKVLEAAALIRKITGRSLKVAEPKDYYEKVFNKIIQDERVHKRVQKKGITIEEYGGLLREIVPEILKKITFDSRKGRNPYRIACAAFIGADVLISQIPPLEKTYLVPQGEIAKICGVKDFPLGENYRTVVKPLIKKLEPQLSKITQN